MKLVSDLYNKLASFKKNEKGSIIPLAAISITALALAGGAAVDYARYASTKSLMDTALDAAILDAGKRLGLGQPVDQKFEDDFITFFNVNITGRGGFTDNYEIVSFSADADTGKVSASAKAVVDATLMRIGGFDKLNALSSSGGIFEQRDTEVTIMLDTTGSMRGTKIVALRSAATEAVNILLEGDNKRTTRVGIVPYASSINAHKYASRATYINDTPEIASTDAFAYPNFNVPTTKCVTGRGGRDAATDTSYADFAPVGSDYRSVQNPNSFFRCPDAEIRPLTNDATELTLEIDGLRADGYTAGHLGIAWSYYMLSPKWNTLWQDPKHEAAAYTDDVNKVAILMTDGVFNTAYDAVGNGSNDPFNTGVSEARSQSVSADLCENMKASGIVVYSIAFELNDDDARDLLDDCATDDSGNTVYFYRADNEDELKQAFRDIVDSITSLRLTQ